MYQRKRVPLPSEMGRGGVNEVLGELVVFQAKIDLCKYGFQQKTDQMVSSFTRESLLGRKALKEQSSITLGMVKSYGNRTTKREVKVTSAQ